MNSVSSPVPITLTTAVPSRPAAATAGASEPGPVRAASRRNSPAPKTTIATAPTSAAVWKTSRVGTSSKTAWATPSGLPRSASS